MIYGSSITIGILLAVLAAAIGTTSKQLIAASEHYKKPWMFHLGASMNVALGPVVDASAYAFAPQVVVAPFACLDVIFNAMTAPYTLSWQNERLTRTHFIGTGFVALGAVMTSLFANVDNKVYNVYELEEQLFWRPTSVIYIMLELCAIGSANFALRKKLLNPAFRGVSLGVVAGVLMGNVFFMKGLIGLIQTTAQTGDFSAWLRLTPYILAACAAGGAVYGHIVMRKGLGEYKGVFMVTIFEGAHISAACLSGCVVMEELAGYPWWQYCLYWSSVATIISGMVAMNFAANSAQIEGKGKIYHVAQVDGTPQNEEVLHPSASPGRCRGVEPRGIGHFDEGHAFDSFDGSGGDQDHDCRRGSEVETVEMLSNQGSNGNFAPGGQEQSNGKAQRRTVSSDFKSFHQSHLAEQGGAAFAIVA